MPIPARLSCQVQEHAGGVQLTVAGQIDYSTRDTFDVAVRAVLTAYPGRVVVDLTGVSFMSSEGVSVLIDAARRAAEAGTKLSITTSAQVWRRLDLFGLTQALPLTVSGPPL